MMGVLWGGILVQRMGGALLCWLFACFRVLHDTQKLMIFLISSVGGEGRVQHV
jgi:hypothetical protein